MTAGDLITKPWHVEWNGLLLGWPDSKWTIQDLDGWLSLPTSRATYTDKQGRWGTYAGQQTFGSRTIEVTFELTDYADADTLNALRRALSPLDDPQEQPLVIWCGTDLPEMVYARVDKAAIPTDYAFSMGYTTCTVSWLCSDAVRYSAQEFTADTGPGAAASTDGLKFPLQFPLTFGSGSGGGILTVTNTGSTTAWPQFSIQGPITGPIITCLNTGQDLAFSPTLVLGASDLLNIHTADRYIEQGGVSRTDKLTTRQWFGLAPHVPTRILFKAIYADPAARLYVTWRNTSAL